MLLVCMYVYERTSHRFMLQNVYSVNSELCTIRMNFIQTKHSTHRVIFYAQTIQRVRDFRLHLMLWIYLIYVFVYGVYKSKSNGTRKEMMTMMKKKKNEKSEQ